MKKFFALTLCIGIFMHTKGISQHTISNKNLGSRHNILWIVADDLGTDIGSYGNELISTPNLDQLALESVQYTNLNTVTAVCSPSRSALIIGVYPVTIGLQQHRTQFKRDLPKGVLPITEYFKESGYFVTDGLIENLYLKGKTDYNFIHDSSTLYHGTHWRGREKNQPFFAQIQISYPHRPFAKDPLNPIDPNQVVLPPYHPDHPLLRKDWTLYLETIQLVDNQVGKILANLKEDGLMENTIVFFFGDQGRPHVRAKQFLYTPGTNTPLLIRWPDGKGAGTVATDLVSTIDLLLVSLELAGIPIPWYMSGINFLNNKRNYVYTMRDRRDETVDRIRVVRDERFKYIKNYYSERPYMQSNVYKDLRYPARPLLRVLKGQGKLNKDQLVFLEKRPGEELYDLEVDPYEVHNLAEDPFFQDKLLELRNSLETWVMEFDKGTYPQDPKEIEFATQQAMKRKDKILGDRGFKSSMTDSQMLAYWSKRYGIKD